MNDWKECKLRDVTQRITKGTTPSTVGGRFLTRGINFIKSEAVSYNGKIDKSTFAFIDETTHNKLRRSQLEKCDILFSMAGIYLGKTGYVSEDILPANTNQALAIIRVDPQRALPKFIHFVLQQNSVIEYVNNISGQSAQPNINMEEIGTIEISLPSLPEQEAIAELLSSIDDKIDLLLRNNKTLEDFSETIFRQWFIEEVNNEWEDTSLDQHTFVFRGLSYKGSGLSVEGNGVPMHNLNSVYEGGGYKFEGIKYYNGEYKERHLVNPGDIIVTNTEQGHEFKLIGFPAIIPNSFEEQGIFSQHIYKLVRSSKTYLTNEFIYYLLMTPTVRDQIVAATNGSTVNMLAIDGLQRPVFKLPSKLKVVEFSNIVSAAWDKKSINQTQIKTLSILRDTLLPKMMSGTVRVNNFISD